MVIDGDEFAQRLDLMKAFFGIGYHGIGATTNTILENKESLVDVSPILSMIIKPLINDIDNVRKLSATKISSLSKRARSI